MQDGIYKDEESFHPIGKAIFVFVGGTSSSFAEFCGEKIKIEKEKQLFLNKFKESKGPDFISRLRGYINILGPNQVNEFDQFFMIRRAMLIRSLLEQKFPHLINEKGIAQIDNGVLRAMLKIPKYKHALSAGYGTLTVLRNIDLTVRRGDMSVVRLNGDERVAVLVDGHPVDNVQGMVSGHGTLDLNTLPGVQNIEKIEVVKGNGSALYGSNAVGGVINIITKKGTKNQSTLDLNTGSWGTHTYTMTNEGNYGKTSWFVTGELGRQGYYDYRHGNDTIKLDGSGKDSNYTDNSFTARMLSQRALSCNNQYLARHVRITSSVYGC